MQIFCVPHSDNQYTSHVFQLHRVNPLIMTCLTFGTFFIIGTTNLTLTAIDAQSSNKYFLEVYLELSMENTDRQDVSHVYHPPLHLVPMTDITYQT